MEILVVVTIIIILAAIVVPTVFAMLNKAHQTSALSALRQLGSGMTNYVSQNDGTLPGEDAPGPDTWNAASLAENANVWYNAIPKLLGMRTVGEYGNDPRAFYTKQNILFSQGAKYPEGDAKLKMPLFAYAINTKVQRKLGAPVKGAVKLGVISNAGRTVCFLEQGLPGEKKAMDQQPKYDGSCKGSAKSFVARYGDKGVLEFFDGHVEVVSGKDILTTTGAFPYPQTNIVWTRTAEENPNK